MSEAEVHLPAVQPDLLPARTPTLELIKPGRRPPGSHAYIIAPPNQPRDKWLQTRRLGIGGSDVAAIAGVSKYASPYAIWLDKTGRYSGDVNTIATKLGTMMEPIVLELFREETGMGALTSPGTLQHPKHEFMLVNLDGIATEAPGKRKGIGVVECKTNLSLRPQDWGDENEDEPLSPEYMLQVQHELEVSGWDIAYVPVIIAGPRFKILRIERDQDLIDQMIEIEAEFWELVRTDTPPPMDGMESTSKILNKVWQCDPGKIIEADESALSIITEINEWKAAEKRAKERKTEAENRIKAMIGDGELLRVGERDVCTWKTVDVKPHSVAGSSYRKLHIKKEKQEK